jgi:hypothetical protein
MMDKNPEQAANENSEKVDEREKPGESELTPEFAPGWCHQPGDQNDPQKKDAKPE